MSAHNHHHVHLVSHLLGVGGVHKACVHFASGHVVQHLTHAVALNKGSLHGFPQFGVAKGVLGVAAHGHRFGIADGDLLELLELVKLGRLLAASRDNKNKIVFGKVHARGGVHNLGGHGFVHGGLVGGSEDVHGRAFLNLLEQGVGRGKVHIDLEIGVALFKHAFQFGEGIGQAGRA